MQTSAIPAAICVRLSEDRTGDGWGGVGRCPAGEGSRELMDGRLGQVAARADRVGHLRHRSPVGRAGPACGLPPHRWGRGGEGAGPDPADTEPAGNAGVAGHGWGSDGRQGRRHGGPQAAPGTKLRQHAGDLAVDWKAATEPPEVVVSVVDALVAVPPACRGGGIIFGPGSRTLGRGRVVEGAFTFAYLTCSSLPVDFLRRSRVEIGSARRA